MWVWKDLGENVSGQSLSLTFSTELCCSAVKQRQVRCSVQDLSISVSGRGYCGEYLRRILKQLRTFLALKRVVLALLHQGKTRIKHC